MRISGADCTWEVEDIPLKRMTVRMETQIPNAATPSMKTVEDRTTPLHRM